MLCYKHLLSNYKVGAPNVYFEPIIHPVMKCLFFITGIISWWITTITWIKNYYPDVSMRIKRPRTEIQKNLNNSQMQCLGVWSSASSVPSLTEPYSNSLSPIASVFCRILWLSTSLALLCPGQLCQRNSPCPLKFTKTLFVKRSHNWLHHTTLVIAAIAMMELVGCYQLDLAGLCFWENCCVHLSWQQNKEQITDISYC